MFSLFYKQTIFLVIHDENAQLSLKQNYKKYKLVITTFPNKVKFFDFKDISKRFNKSNFIFFIPCPFNQHREKPLKKLFVPFESIWKLQVPLSTLNPITPYFSPF